MSANADKSKEWQMELLMEKLRSKSSQFKQFPEISKNVRMTMLEKRYNLDSVEKAQHQKCLDALQHCIKVTSSQSMVERLESLTRQLGLKFMTGPSNVDELNELFISSDMFYLEVILESAERGGGVRDVKIHHEGKNEQQSCAELVYCLSRQDFADFTLQLEGLASIYQLNAEKKVKSKAFSALTALETDLSTLAQYQTVLKEPFNLLHKSAVGFLEKRRGGHAMKLTYFVSPYEMIDTTRERVEPITVERVVSKKLGFSATVCIEGSTPHKLPITPIITVSRGINNTGNSSPSYAVLNNQNSAVIPACFTLKLSKPMSVCTVLAKRIQALTQLDCGDVTTSHPLLSLITKDASDSQLDCANNRGLFVTLPDQQHCYFLTEGRNLQGVTINSIPFTHPHHVPPILTFLRQQALFNTVLASCIRPNSRQDLENMIMFEVSALSWQNLSISLEHPIEESMATADIDLTDISNVTCKIYGPNNTTGDASPKISEIATKVLQRCLSIPVTMRAVIRAWEEMHESKKFINGNENFSLPLGSDDPGGNKNSSDSPLTDYSNLESKMKSDHNGNSNLSSNSHQSNFIGETLGFPSFSANSNSTSSSSDKYFKKHKRKNKEDNWKSPKRKIEENSSDLFVESSCSSDSISTALSHAETPSSTLEFQSDFDLSGLDPSELISSDKNTLDFDCSNDDLEEILSKKSDESEKDAPSVSITPVSNKLNFMLNEIERRPGIEIIPIANSTSLPSSITITPIASSSSSKSEDRSRDRKVSKSSDKSKMEKKRKRKRDDDNMNPPDKINKQDPLTKPVSVSIKPTDLLPLSPSKHSSSPSHKGSPSSKHTSSKLKSVKSPCSPKHSPSPKHSSSSSTGKPSMSTLKSATSTSKSESRSKSKDPNREKKSSSSSSPTNSKIKSSSKPKSSQDVQITENNSSPTSLDLSKSSQNQQRNRKGILSAIVDNLHKKSGQHCPEVELSPSSSSSSSKSSSNRDSSRSTQPKTDPLKPGSKETNKNSEYMVKPSSDGMKITINKTRSKENSKLLNSVPNNLTVRTPGSNSPKTHTGLKPGVNSGPASKKSTQTKTVTTSSSNSPTMSKSMTSSTKSTTLSKSNSSGSLMSSSKSSSSKLSSSSLDRNKLRTSFKSDKPSLLSSARSSEMRRSSPTILSSRDDADGMKILGSKNDFQSHLMVEGLIIKQQLDTKFQIPKLSSKLQTSNPSSSSTISSNEDKKYPKSLPNQYSDLLHNNRSNSPREELTVTGIFGSNLDDLKITKLLSNDTLIVPTTSALPHSIQHIPKTSPNQMMLPEDCSKRKESSILPNDIIVDLDDNNCKKMLKSLTDGGVKNSTTELAMKVVTTTSQEVAEMLLDFSTTKNNMHHHNHSVQSMLHRSSSSLPSSPSVSVHIMNTPAASPLVIPSPHSASPCITDDDLMDEALVGIGK